MRNIVEYPFEVQLATAQQAGFLNVDVSVTGHPDRAYKDLSDYLGRFEMLARSGALSGSTFSPSSSGLALATGPQGQERGSSIRCEYTEVRIDSRSIFVLLNLLYHFHAHLQAIRLVRVVWSNLASIGIPLTVSFPEQTPSLSYQLEREETGRRFDILVTFPGVAHLEILKQVDGEMGNWFAAASLGAYGDSDFPPPESAIYYADEPVEFTQDSIIWRMDGMRCSEEALNGLANVLEKISRKIIPISRVVFGA